MSRVLVVEDELHLAEGLRFNLEEEGYVAEVVGDGEGATEKLLQRKEPFDVVVLDIMLPGKDGFEVVSELRAARNYVPVLLLTAGLLRRSQWMRGGKPSAAVVPPNNKGDVGDFGRFSFAGKTIDFGALELRSGGNTIHLTLMESELLRHLVQNDGKIVSRKQILEEVWGLHEDTDTRAIDNFVVRLRRYIEDDPGSPKHLKTVRGVGYRFVANPEK